MSHPLTRQLADWHIPKDGRRTDWETRADAAKRNLLRRVDDPDCGGHDEVEADQRRSNLPRHLGLAVTHGHN